MSETTLARIGDALSAADAGIDASLARLFDLLRIPSISTQPAHAADCRRAGEWLVGELTGLGLSASLRETAGHPIVVAHAPGGGPDDRRPHVLFYGHYDVQPVDPLSLWDSPPFEPRFEGEGETRRVVARGASDDKGQVLTFIEALRALHESGVELPVRVSLLIEGEEESGGASLPGFLADNAGELACDVALICDTDMLPGRVPAICAMLRGLVGEEVVLRAADRDLHSGMFGNAAANPIAILARILADLRDGDGRVTLAGFYDGVPVIPEALRAQWATLGLDDDAAMLSPYGLSQAAGEHGFSAMEQVWVRPSCEINGIAGGYSGDGFKTVLPAEAMAKVSFRLVGTQDPDAIRAAFRKHVTDRLPPDVTASFHPHGGSRAVSLPLDGPWLRAALGALSEEWGSKAAVVASGGSIPVATLLLDTLGVETLLIGFARADDRIHSPNEKYDVDSFHHGIRSWIRVLAALGTVKAA